MKDNFIPVEVINENDNWYMDVSNLSLSELIKLRDSLTGTVSFRVLDSIIYQKSDVTFETYNRFNRRENKRNKEIYLKQKKYKKR